MNDFAQKSDASTEHGHVEEIIKRLWWVYLTHLLGRHQLTFEDFRDIVRREFR